MKFAKIGVLLIAVLFSSCSGENKSEDLYKEVMGFHDEVMPYMGSLYQAEKKMKKMIAELDSTATDQKKMMEAQLDTLISAQDNMTNWMREMSAAYEGEMEEEEKITVLKDQLEKVKAISDELKAAKRIADKL